MKEHRAQDLTSRYEERDKLHQEIDSLERDRFSNVEQSASKAAQTNIGSAIENSDDLIGLRARLVEIDAEIEELESANDPPDEDLPGANLVDEDSTEDDVSEDVNSEVDPQANPWEALTQRFGTQLAVACVEKSWELPVNALVLPVGVRGGMYGGLAKALQAEVGEDVWKDFLEHVETAVSTMTPEDPILITLPVDLGAKILPNAPEIEEGARYQIIAATPARSSRQNPDNEEFFPEVASSGIIKCAIENKITKIAIPLLGTGLGQQQGEFVIRDMIKAIYDAIPETNNPLEQVIITTRPTAKDDKSGVLSAAHDIVDVILHNRSQPFVADSASGEDTLGIEEEVSALAETLLLRDVETPLAVGVLGGWGSGKSFVMYLMLKRMMEIRSQRLDQNHCWGDNAGAFVGHVYPIEFNAWTYAKSDLWASLMQTIFMKLNQQLTMERLIGKDLLLAGSYWLELSGLGDKEREALQSEVGQDAIADAVKQWQQGDAPDSLWEVYDTLRSSETATMKAALNAREEKQITLANLDNELEAEKVNEIPEQAREQVWKEIVGTAVFSTVAKEIQDDLKEKTYIDENGQKQKVFSEQDLQDLGKLNVKLKQFRPTMSQMWEEQTLKNWWRNQKWVLITAIILIIVAIVVVPYVSGNWDWLSQTSTITSITAILASIGSMAMGFYRTYQPWVEKIQRWNDGINSVVTMAQEMLNTKEDQIIVQKELQLEAERKSLESEIAELNLEIAQHQHRLGIAGEFTSLYDFVSSRLAAGDYQERLGMLHQTQADLQELTNTLMVHGDDDLFAQQKQEFFPRGPARVVLFVDDLDRCPPDKVVEVLEAIQLLLRTRLFIVVLGLDTRYVTRALEKEYVDILTRMGDPSGLDYIEKIIQIPYRVRPIEPAKIGKFLEGQMDIIAEPPSPGQNEGDEAGEADGEPVVPTGSTISSTDPEKNDVADLSQSDDVKSTDYETPTDKTREQTTEAVPEPALPKEVKFHKADKEDLERACVALGLTPRSIKRLINVLKLIKVYWFRTNQNKKRREIRTVINLLTLSARHPEIMAQIFHDIEMAYREERQSSEHLSRFLELKTENEKLSSLAKQEQFETAVTNLKAEDITLAELGLETFHLIQSFSFVGDPTYNT